MREWKIGEKILRLIEGNIALLEVEAIVNAANKNLKLGGGVAGAIRNFGGPSIQEECDRLAPIEVGQAVLTGAGKLKAKYIIHAVGPVYGEGEEEKKLQAATLASLEIARQKQIVSIAFPAISTGIFGFPIDRCSEIMVSTAVKYLKNNDYPRLIIFCLYTPEAYRVFETTAEKIISMNG